MSMLTADMSQVVDVVAAGVKQNLADALEKKFHEQADPIIRQLAIDYAQKIVVKIRTMQMSQDNSINLAVIFNDEHILAKQDA